MQRSHARGAAAALCAAGLMLLGSCTNTSTGAAGDAQGPGDTTGVSADTVKVGWPVLDQNLLVQAGFAVDIGDTTTIATKMVDDWNASGGVNGRKVELVNRSFGTDIANLLPDMQRVCLELTEDQQVFATVAVSWFGDAVTCVAGDHGTPLITESSMADTVLESGKGNVFLANFAWEEALRSAVRVVDDAGELGGFQKIGVFGQLEPGMRQAIDNGLAPALEEAGTSLAADGTIPFSASLDNSAVAAVVSRFKAENVDAVFAHGQLLRERRVHDRGAAAGLPPDLRDVGLVRGNRRPDPEVRTRGAARPRRRSELEGQATGSRPDRRGPGLSRHLRPHGEGIGHPGDRRHSDLRADEPAAPRPRGSRQPWTRQSFVGAMQGLGQFTTSGGGLASFGPDNHTMPDQVRLVRFDLAGCQCWTAEGDWVDVQG